MNKIQKIIITFPIQVLSLMVFLAVYSTDFFPQTLKVLFFITLYFYLFIFFLRILFLGRFKGRAPKLDGGNKSIYRAIIGLLIMYMFFSIGFYSILIEMNIDKILTLLSVGAIVGLVMNVYEYKMMTHFGVTKVDNGISITKWRDYIAWYHFIALLLLVGLIYAKFIY